jgi:hypothetical protein
MQDRGRLFVAAVTAVLLAGCVAQTVQQERWKAVYDRSISAAALSVEVHPLRPINAEQAEVTVVHVQAYPTITTYRHVWVALPDELRPFCKGKANPRLALQMALGLKPEDNDLKVFTLKVRPADLFRPCATSPDITSASCRKVLDGALPVEPGHAQFMTMQMASSYRPDGYPFTAMGWSYNWDPGAASPRGVSEYVVRPGAVVGFESVMPPAAFCAM